MKGEDKMRSKVGNCFYIVVPKLFNLTNQNGLNPKSLLVHPLQQDQKKKTKINKKSNQT